MSDIIIRDRAGNSYAFTPTAAGYMDAQRKIDQLEHDGMLDSGDLERVYDVTQPSHRETGVRSIFHF